MKPIFFSLLLASVLSNAGFAQADGSFYTLQLGPNTSCPFKYGESKEVLHAVASGKDSATFIRRTLSLQHSDTKSIHTRSLLFTDTVIETNPKTNKKETKIISADPTYHFETVMRYTDFLLLLKQRFELKNPQKNERVYSFKIYYETPDTAGSIDVQYPQTYEGVISRLNCLAKPAGGFLLLWLKAAEHGMITIDEGQSFLALIRIKE